MSNPFGCPNSVYQAMQGASVPEMLAAVAKLGPRMRWSDEQPAWRNQGLKDSPTNWLLDGRPATRGQIIAAAGASHAAAAI